MAKFLIQASYTVEGTQGLLREGGTKRKAVVEETLRAVGGKLEVFYYALGQHDAYIIADFPDSVSAMALSMAVNSTGAVTTKTTPLLTVEDMDKAVKMKINYRKPGQ
jgi:uncharacterized protein with GYD domain